jgi:amino-acid N-acetyltransferase
LAAVTGPIAIRRASTHDVASIRAIVEGYAADRILLGKDIVTLYEDVPDFRVAVNSDGRVVGCGAVHVMWEDLAEVRTLAVLPEFRGRGIGRDLLTELVDTATALGVDRVVCLTFEVDFFSSQGFQVAETVDVAPEVFMQMVRSLDEGIAEFLDLERVRPNTLGNTRMVRTLRD